MANKNRAGQRGVANMANKSKLKFKLMKFFLPRRYKRKIAKARKIFRAKGLIAQYRPERIGKHFTDFGATFSQIKRGKLNQADIVIINLELPTDIQSLWYMFSSINHFYDFKSIKQDGIYTNITFGDSFYGDSIHAI